MDDMKGLGTLSAFTCPSCRGPLWELRDGEMVRYRCYTGHAYSAESLLAEADGAAEDALYAAIRALEEKGTLSRRMAQTYAERIPMLEAERLAEAAEMERKVSLLRRLIAAQNDKAAKGITPRGESPVPEKIEYNSGPK